jgi:hypothetical protein
MASMSQLVDVDLNQQNLSRLKRIFLPEEVSIIQSILISNTNQDDLPIWRGTGSRLFSVRNAYHLQKSLVLDQMAEGSSRSYGSELWRRLWNLLTPNVEKHFFWRACNEILPTRDNLCRRKVINDPRCRICEIEVETTFYIFVAMLISKGCLEFGKFKIPKECLRRPKFFFFFFFR